MSFPPKGPETRSTGHLFYDDWRKQNNMDKKIKLKSRARGLSNDASEEKKPLISNEPEEKADDPISLMYKINAYTRYLNCATSRKERLTALMERKSARKWDAGKKQKMVRRLMTANSECEESLSTLGALQAALEQLISQPPQTSNADFIPPPATSV